MSKSVVSLIELALWSKGVKKIPSNRIDEIAVSYDSIQPMNKGAFINFVEMWSDILTKENE